MKKLGLLLIVLMTTITIFGQTTKGNFVLSGATGLQFISSSETSVYHGGDGIESKISSFSFMPTFGYFIEDNIAIGLSGNISTQTVKYSFGKMKSNSVVIMPTFLYYFPLDGKIRPLVQAGFGYSSEKSPYNSDYSVGNFKYSGAVVNLGGGISYFITEKTSINFGLSYTRSNLNRSDDSADKIKRGEFSSNIGISVFL